MRKGIVMKLNKNKATLITEECLFYEVKAFNGMYEGMEICFSNMDILKRKNTFINNKYIQAACFVLIVFSSYLFLSFYQENIATYAYVGIGINPSIEMSLNKKDKITKVIGLDEDGVKLTTQLNIEQMDSVNGVKEIIIKTIDMGYLNEKSSNEITVYTITNEKENGDELAEKLKTAIKKEISSHNIDKDVKAIVSDKKTKDNADKAGISVLKYIKEDTKSTATQNDKDKHKSLKNDKDDKKKIENEEDKLNKNIKIDRKDKSHKNVKIDNKEETDNKNQNSKYVEKKEKEKGKTNKKNENNHETKNKKDSIKEKNK